MIFTVLKAAAALSQIRGLYWSSAVCPGLSRSDYKALLQTVSGCRVADAEGKGDKDEPEGDRREDYQKSSRQ